MDLYLIPPSEGKCSGGVQKERTHTFDFLLPYDIATRALPKDLKCTGKRYDEAITLNKSFSQGPVLESIQRYTGVFYQALGYNSLEETQKERIDTHVLIVSGLFGLLHPHDLIPNYKLPIETAGLRRYRYPLLTENLVVYCKKMKVNRIIDLLPKAYQRVIDLELLKSNCIDHSIPNIHTPGVTHGIKKMRGEWLRQKALGG